MREVAGMRASICSLIGAVGFLLPMSAPGQIVRGEVTDSVSTSRLAGVSVALLDTRGQTIDQTVTDPEGRFLLYSPSAGEYRLRVTGEGYRPSTFPQFSLELDDEKGFRLLVATLADASTVTAADLINQICEEGSVVGQSGTILGVVRDQDGDPIAEADVIFSWPAVSSGLADLMEGEVLDDVVVAVGTDSAGFYAACGVPGQTAVSFHAVHDGRFSEFNAVRFVIGGVEQGGAIHPSDDRLWVQELRVVPEEMHTAGVNGVIREETTGLPVPNARAQLLGTERETTADSLGRFSLGGLPAGPGKLRVRTIGYHSRDVAVQLQPNIFLVLGAESLLLTKAPTELTPIEITTDAPNRGRLGEFAERREDNVGMFITREEFVERGNPQTPTDVLQRMGGIKIIPNPAASPRFLIVITRTASRGAFGGTPQGTACAPIAFLDGHYLGRTNEVDVDAVINMEHLQAVEAYASTASMPMEFNRPGATCGVVAFWTR
jgi:hypothetical protein